MLFNPLQLELGMITRTKKSVTDFGGDGQVIILLHGFLSSSKFWKQLQPVLSASGYRVIAIDLLGFGNAPKPTDSSYSYQEHLAYIDGVIDKLKLDKPIALIGHSMGALLSARYAVLNPGKVSSLTLLHPPLFLDKMEARTALRATGRLYRFLLYSKYRRFGWAIIKTFNLYQIDKHSRIARELSLKNVIEASEMLGDLAIIDTKSLLLVGLKDRPEYARNIKTARFSDRVKVITKNVAHNSPSSSPLLIQQSIIDFL